MEITDVRVRKVALDGKMRAIVSITLDNEFVVHDIKVIEGENLDLLVGSIPAASDDEKEKKEMKDRVKANILNILSKEYGVDEEDFLSADLAYAETLTLFFCKFMILSFCIHKLILPVRWGFDQLRNVIFLLKFSED